ncbi:adenylyltransferase/cytidyltransferase family protein [Streptomyces sp. NBC_00873]|uniref:adenylyltransferase/cytidyltransferase family protein n=1 Tax=Streptomyces sp. NBC_00873 TaxID=2975852 RepID=UPI003870B3FB|nr:adenylyltransferase/cytidyltransferase family protein [Streptomyces sp. NBC_00873]
MSKAHRVGYAPGAYDLFHIGHLNILRHARAQCDCLVAGVVSDEMAERAKGRRPMIPLVERLEIVRSIRYVHAAFVETVERDDDGELEAERHQQQSVGRGRTDPGPHRLQRGARADTSSVRSAEDQHRPARRRLHVTPAAHRLSSLRSPPTWQNAALEPIRQS